MSKGTTMTEQIYEYLCSVIPRQGYAPSVREIGDAVGLKSPSTVHCHLKRLQERGLIEKCNCKGRTIVLTGCRERNPVQAATIIETTPRSMALRVEITTEDFDDIEMAYANGWYRKHYYCPSCNSELKTETFEHAHCFGSWCAVSKQVPMHHCPNCGTKISHGE